MRTSHVSLEGRVTDPDVASGRLPTLDGWRTIAISLVLLSHGAFGIAESLGPYGDFLISYDMRAKLGRLGVRLFFGLSGFLITLRLLDEEHRHPGGLLKRFYVRRFFRIQPPALLFLAVVAVLGTAGIVDVDVRYWLASMFCYSNYDPTGQTWALSHFWSLAVEEHFYLVWPTLFMLLGPTRRVAGALLLLFGIAFWRAVVIKTGFTNGPAFSTRTDLVADGLLAGCVVALLYASYRWRSTIERVVAPLGQLVIATLFLVSVCLELSDWKLRQGLLLITTATIPLLILGTVVRPRSWLSRFLELAPMRFIGRLSYGIYLWQQLFFTWPDMRSPKLGVLQSWPLCIVPMFACALASYYLYERHMIRWGARVAASIGKRAPESAPIAQSISMPCSRHSAPS